ncbi:hypothetical protein K435DRAFT_877511 [Dendrothele bispora CBS 962.96]|uniref:Uncharacterized protein n=1 Tax=Dendrothele bispora (strain CBS 962.96) TaxID=1314807 RepID=A0A4S8KPU8_DENBC|nr:hypothetical protein K435DRAFT_877511 [Dendrothele bispora CBS 962.96]
MVKTERKLKRERESSNEEQNTSGLDAKRQRKAFSAAGIQIGRNLGSGGYFDSQTSDTQYFDFSQSSGQHVYHEEESQPHFGSQDDDWYQYESQSQSQIAEEYEDTSTSLPLPHQDMLSIRTRTPATPLTSSESTNTEPINTNNPNVDNHSESPVSRLSGQAGTLKQRLVNDVLTAKYQSRNLAWEFLKKRNDRDDVKRRWLTLKGDDRDGHPARIALQHLAREAGVDGQAFHQANPVRQGHLVVASILIRVANELICHGGQAENIEMLKETVMDGNVLLELAGELVDIEKAARAWIDTE